VIQMILLKAIDELVVVMRAVSKSLLCQWIERVDEQMVIPMHTM
jgi:hypothetical protein